ncbi:MAG: type IV pilus modification PilV family protein [Minisyncoccota bacterium]
MNHGFGLIEIIVGTAVLAASFLGISAYYQQSLKVSQSTTQVVQASLLLEESLEVAKIFRDTGWANISAPADGTTYFLSFNGVNWATSTTNVFIDGTFERTVTLHDVYRDGNDDIVSAGGVLDAGTRKITATVSWRNHTGTTTRAIETYLTDIL